MHDDPSAPLFAAALPRTAVAPRRVLCLDATPEIVALPALGAARVVAVQSWRPLHDRLRDAGIDTHPEIADDEGGFDLALVRLGRSRARNLGALAEAITRLSPDGVLIAAGHNDLGPASHARSLGAREAITRFHGRAFWIARAAAPTDATLAQWRRATALCRVPPDGHYASPGGFAWDRVDAGSTLLAETLPADIAGRVADLGCGWGYLSLRLTARCPGIVALDLYEADHASLQAARRNLEHVPGAAFHWADVARGLSGRDYDAVVMNPPFHDDRAADPSIGRAFIRAAAAALRPGGRLWMVANRRLPYEAELRGAFARCEVIGEEGGYKLVAAIR